MNIMVISTQYIRDPRPVGYIHVVDRETLRKYIRADGWRVKQ